MGINGKDIIARVIELDGAICDGCGNQVKVMHVEDLKKEMQPILSKHTSDQEESVLDTAINYLVDSLGWTEGHLKGEPGYYTKL